MEVQCAAPTRKTRQVSCPCVMSSAVMTLVTEQFVEELREMKSRVVVVDAHTAPALRQAAGALDWPVTLVSVGSDPVPDTTHVSAMLQDDGTGSEQGAYQARH